MRLLFILTITRNGCFIATMSHACRISLRGIFHIVVTDNFVNFLYSSCFRFQDGANVLKLKKTSVQFNEVSGDERHRSLSRVGPDLLVHACSEVVHDVLYHAAYERGQCLTSVDTNTIRSINSLVS